MASYPHRKQAILETYNNWGDYDTKVARFSYKAPTLVAKHLAPVVGARAKILDVGCGTGLVGAALRRQAPRCTLVGVDISTGMLAQAERQKIYNDLQCLDLRSRLPFRSRTFDAVVCLGVFEHFRTIRRELAEFARVSKRYVAFYVLITPFSNYHHHPPPRLYRVLNDAGLFPTQIFPFTAYYHTLGLGVIAQRADRRIDATRHSVTYYAVAPHRTKRQISLRHLISSGWPTHE